MKNFVSIYFSLLFSVLLNTTASAQVADLLKGKSYGSFMFFEKAPNALFFGDDIKKNDGFEFRKAIRNHNIDTVVLSSPGGDLWEGLTIAGMIFDKKLTTYVPKDASCASACAFMFFAGNKKQATGKLGVHQFYSASGTKSAKIADVEYGSQFKVSEIIGFLNEFKTPPFVFERMFETDRGDMYFFSSDELIKLNSKVIDEGSLASFRAVEDFVVKARDLVQQEVAKSVREKPAEVVTNNDRIIALNKKVQSELNRIGCTLGITDGLIGPASRRALVKFNTLNNSSFDPETFFTSSKSVEMLGQLNAGFCTKVVKVQKVKKISAEPVGWTECPRNIFEAIVWFDEFFKPRCYGR